LENWDHLGGGKVFDYDEFKDAFEAFDDDGSGAIEKEEMGEFLDTFLNPPEVQGIRSKSPGLTR
jgi:Ca2+-binding EF-hand superfamily protein